MLEFDMPVDAAQLAAGSDLRCSHLLDVADQPKHSARKSFNAVHERRSAAAS
jgi:hypothetical protein